MMTVSPFQIALVLYFALGLRIGWIGQLLVLLVASACACLAALFFVYFSDQRFFVHYLLAAAVSDAAIQIGFVVGLLTSTRSATHPYGSRQQSSGGRSWVLAALDRIDDRGMPNNVFSRLTALAGRAVDNDRQERR